MKKILIRNRLLSFLAGFSVVMIIAVVWWFNRAPSSGSDKQEMIKVRDSVSKLVILPTGEDPTLATVTDKNSLTDNFLKTNAENGDKILVYITAKKVYIYRPSINKIVNIGPLTIDASASEAKGIRVLVRTGNNKQPITQDIKSQIIQNYKSATVAPIEQAARQDYPSTIVIDLTEGDKYDLVTNMMQLLNAQRGILPQGEAKPDNVDILIITGLDKQ